MCRLFTFGVLMYVLTRTGFLSCFVAKWPTNKSGALIFMKVHWLTNPLGYDISELNVMTLSHPASSSILNISQPKLVKKVFDSSSCKSLLWEYGKKGIKHVTLAAPYFFNVFTVISNSIIPSFISWLLNLLIRYTLCPLTQSRTF